jgi:hypothetical protein
MDQSRVCRTSLLFAGVVITCVSGCGASKTVVSGKVSYKGKPLAMGTICIVGANGIAVPAAINPDGTYRIEGVALGMAKIGVSNLKPTTPQMAAHARKGRTPANAPPPPDIANWFEIPEKYADPKTSDLTVELTGGEIVHNLDLQ